METSAVKRRMKAEGGRMSTAVLLLFSLLTSHFSLSLEAAPLSPFRELRGFRERFAVRSNAAVAEQFTINMTGQTGAALALADPAVYITCADDAGAVYVWFKVTDGVTNIDPAPGGRGIFIDLGTPLNAIAIASATAAYIDADSKFSATNSGAVVTVVNSVTGARTDADDGTTSMTVATTVQGAGGE